MYAYLFEYYAIKVKFPRPEQVIKTVWTNQ